MQSYKSVILFLLLVEDTCRVLGTAVLPHTVLDIVRYIVLNMVTHLPVVHLVLYLVLVNPLVLEPVAVPVL